MEVPTAGGLTFDFALYPLAVLEDKPAVAPLHLPVRDAFLFVSSFGVDKHSSKRSVSAEISGCSGVCCTVSAGCSEDAMTNASPRVQQLHPNCGTYVLNTTWTQQSACNIAATKSVNLDLLGLGSNQLTERVLQTDSS